jgi:FixJ family two-component response regulator
MDEAFVHVVDDDPQLRNAMSRLLRSYDLGVKTYESALDFLNRLPEPGPGCLILDLSMPKMNGLQLQETLAANRKNLVVIFVSGKGDIPASVKAMKAGAVDFLTKPFEDLALIEAVREAIRRSQQFIADGEAIDKDWAAFDSLTARERQVCLLVSQGLLNKQVAGELGTTEKTIKFHRGSVTRKLHVNSVADLVKLVERLRDAGRIGPQTA